MALYYTRRDLTAALLGCRVEDILAFVDKAGYGVSVIDPVGRKFAFTNEDLDRKMRKLVEEEHAREAAALSSAPKESASERPKESAVKSAPKKKPAPTRAKHTSTSLSTRLPAVTKSKGK